MEDKVFISDTCIFDRGIYESVISGEKRPGVLLKVSGPVAEWGTLNRNKRLYTEKLWDTVLNSSYVSEQLRYKTLLGECNHPQERYEVDFGRVSHSITKLWKVPERNQVFAEIEILDTPFGKILYTLYEAGSIIGYSSRAGGQLLQRKDHIDVDERTYNFITFDAVPYPSVVIARPEVVNEGVNEKFSLPDNIHDKICEIICENKNNTLLKEFIYNIESCGYDMGREKSVFESSEPAKPVQEVPKTPDKNEQEQTISEATLHLIKESSSQIDGLKADLSSLQAENKSIVAENENLKARLDESVKQLTSLSVESKKQESIINNSKSSYDDTIAKYGSRIKELESVLEEKELELEEMEQIREAFKAVQLENAGMKSSIKNEIEVSESFQAHGTKVEAELKEAYSEISSMVSEIQSKDSEIRKLTESVEMLRNKLADMKSSKSDLVNESKEIESQNSQLIEQLKSDNSRLNAEVQRLTESASYSDYSEDLISVVSGIYGIDPKKVASKLTDGFTKNDVYRVCESMNNSAIRGISYSNINIVESTKTTNTNSNCPDAPKIASIMTGAGNRRGIGLIK